MTERRLLRVGDHVMMPLGDSSWHPHGFGAQVIVNVGLYAYFGVWAIASETS